METNSSGLVEDYKQRLAHIYIQRFAKNNVRQKFFKILNMLDSMEDLRTFGERCEPLTNIYIILKVKLMSLANVR